MKGIARLFLVLACFIAAGTACFSAVCYQGQCLVKSADATPIEYTVSGKGDMTLVFIHGWSCDSRYWQKQVPYFEKRYRVVTIDLAGHGHSGLGRENYTVRGFAEDVKAVVDSLGAGQVLLIGHSMGGDIAASAAVILPGIVIGMVGVDTIQNVEEAWSREDFDKMIYTGFTVDFQKAADKFVRDMFMPGADPALVDWVAADMSSAPPKVGLSVFDNMYKELFSGHEAELFERIPGVPVRCVNAKLWPTNEEANRRHIKSYGVAYLDGVGHFLMLEKPAEFNKLLDTAIRQIETEHQNKLGNKLTH